MKLIGDTNKDKLFIYLRLNEAKRNAKEKINGFLNSPVSIVDYCHASVQKWENVICISVFKLREQSISAIVVYF